jgi:tRNA pseudouridine38-40 synthase
MFNILIRISYDGTNYSGFQLQHNATTIQEKLEQALGVIYKQPLRLIGSGRTDAGVHARGQVANFNAPFKIEVEKIPHALNALLPPDIVVTGAEEVAADFHARFAARGKHYSYTIDCAPFPQVLKRRYSWHLPDPLNLELIREAAQLFQGTHDFKAYQSAGGKITETERTLEKVTVENFPAAQLIRLSFVGSGFLYHMVRLMTGSLVRVGRGMLTLAEIEASLAGNNPTAAGPTAPAHGLCLEKVIYTGPIS